MKHLKTYETFDTFVSVGVVYLKFSISIITIYINQFF